MDTELLVDECIDDGRKLILELLRNEFDVTVGFWVRTSAEGLWLLYISSASVKVEKIAEAYRQVYACLNRMPSSWVSPSEVKLIHPSNPISVAAVMVRDRSPSGPVPTRYHGKRLGPLAIEEAYIYPRARWFQGFDEIKKNFPSAEVFTLPILSSDIDNPAVPQLMGRVNSSQFEGRAPGTVFFLGPQGSSGRALAELCLIYRPEGWNTLFRADTNSWEEVVHVRTGTKLYESADFGPLQALKANQKPAARELEHIKKRLAEGGCYLMISPDPTPIYSIPYTPPAKRGEDTPVPIDWEMIRRIMESGGTIELRGTAKTEKP